MKENNKKIKTPDINEILELNTISTQDCTGLIPSAVTNDEQVEAYEEIYPYLTPPKGLGNAQSSDGSQ